MTTLLKAEGLSVHFGEFHAISRVDLDVAAGSIHSVIGPNGAGKTTLFNALSGVRFPTAGKVIFENQEITNLALNRRVRLGLARSFQLTNIFPELTVAENLRLGVQGASSSAGWVFWKSPMAHRQCLTMVDELLLLLGLEDRATMLAGRLSHGGQRALEIGMALSSEPKLVFLDEPLAGMGIDDVHRTKSLICSLAPKRTVLLVEHNMSVVLDISNRVTVMAQGSKIAEGAPADIRKNASVREAYLGSQA